MAKAKMRAGTCKCVKGRKLCKPKRGGSPKFKKGKC